MTHHEAVVFRQRAAHLRALARRMRNTPSMSLHLHSGADTWYGPRAQQCTTELALAQQRVRHAADELDMQAFRFDREADELCEQARRAARAAELEQR